MQVDTQSPPVAHLNGDDTPHANGDASPNDAHKEPKFASGLIPPPPEIKCASITSPCFSFDVCLT